MWSVPKDDKAWVSWMTPTVASAGGQGSCWGGNPTSVYGIELIGHIVLKAYPSFLAMFSRTDRPKANWQKKDGK